MPQKNPKVSAADRQLRDARNTSAIKAIVEEQRRVSLEKTDRLRAQRLAKEAADAATMAATVVTKVRKARVKAV